MPLSEEELRILQEIEANLTATDPALVQQVSETTLYRHAARSIKWAIFGFVAGLVLLVATFTKVLVLGFVGFLVMLACLLVIERNARKLGKAGMDNLTSSFREGSVGRLLRLSSRGCASAGAATTRTSDPDRASPRASSASTPSAGAVRSARRTRSPVPTPTSSASRTSSAAAHASSDACGSAVVRVLELGVRASRAGPTGRARRRARRGRRASAPARPG